MVGTMGVWTSLDDMSAELIGQHILGNAGLQEICAYVNKTLALKHSLGLSFLVTCLERINYFGS